MTLRTSVNDPNNSLDTNQCGATGNISDFQTVDNTPGFWMIIFSTLFKIFWVAILVLGIASIVLPYLFPQWAEKYRQELEEMGIAANTGRFIKNAASVDWKDAFNKVNFDNLRFVGTGRHPELKANPGLKKAVWYTGQTFIMKGYVLEYDWLKATEDFEGEKVADLLLPATDMNQAQASAYCENQDGRLPTYDELGLAYYLAFTKNWQGKTGRFLKPNLVFKINPQISLWTSTAQGEGFLTRDNFRIFTGGLKNQRYEDDGFESEAIGFLCVKNEAAK